MPLHTQHKAWRAGHGHRFDQTVGGQCFCAQVRRQTIDTLTVQAVDLEARAQPERADQPARLHLHGMLWRVLHRQHLALRLTMIQIAGQLLNPLMQAAAQSDIQLLKTAANAQHRHALSDGSPEQRQCGAVPEYIMSGALHARRSIVVTRLDVGRRAGKQQAIQRREQLRRLGGHLECRQNHRHAGEGCSLDVLVACGVRRILAQLLTAGGDTDQGRSRHSLNPV